MALATTWKVKAALVVPLLTVSVPVPTGVVEGSSAAIAVAVA